jgi:dihydroxyacetone kinase-like protein
MLAFRSPCVCIGMAHSAVVHDLLGAASHAASRGADTTADMLPRRGRARYVGARCIGSVDAGARAIAIGLAALATLGPSLG